MNTKPTLDERIYMARVKSLPCSVCDAPQPSECHHIKQSSAWLCVALCEDCHRGSFAGLHGQRRAWIQRKMDIEDALAVTIKRLNAG